MAGSSLRGRPIFCRSPAGGPPYSPQLNNRHFEGKIRAFSGQKSRRISRDNIDFGHKSYQQRRNLLLVSRFRSAQTVNVDQDAMERVLLALKILTSHYDQNPQSRVTQEEVDELKSYLGDESAGRSPDEIACMVIQREIKRQEEKCS